MYDEKLLRLLALKSEPLRPFPIQGWVHNGHWIARSNVRAEGRPVTTLTPKGAAEFLDDHLNAEWEPLEYVGDWMTEGYDDAADAIVEKQCRLYEGPTGIVAVDEDYAALLDGLKVVHLATDVWVRAPVGGVDADGVLQCWIMPVWMR